MTNSRSLPKRPNVCCFSFTLSVFSKRMALSLTMAQTSIRKSVTNRPTHLHLPLGEAVLRSRKSSTPLAFPRNGRPSRSFSPSKTWLILHQCASVVTKKLWAAAPRAVSLLSKSCQKGRFSEGRRRSISSSTGGYGSTVGRAVQMPMHMGDARGAQTTCD